MSNVKPQPLTGSDWKLGGATALTIVAVAATNFNLNSHLEPIFKGVESFVHGGAFPYAVAAIGLVTAAAAIKHYVGKDKPVRESIANASENVASQLEASGLDPHAKTEASRNLSVALNSDDSSLDEILESLNISGNDTSSLEVKSRTSRHDDNSPSI